MSDIVERLREVAERPDANYPAVMEQAADTITALRAEVERLKSSGIVEEAARVAEETTSYDDVVQKSAGCLTTGQRIAAAIRAMKKD